MRVFASSLLLLVTASNLAWAESCDFYASPNGGGNGFFETAPFKIRNFWAVAKAGTTLCLLDGTYRGADSMIAPSAYSPGVSGTDGHPITIRALNDGGVTIDGQFARMPVSLNRNHWWIIEGLNAKHGTHSVIYAVGSDNNVVRRVVAWDARADANGAVIGLHRSTGWVLEDVAAFGMARKIFSSSQGGNDITCRRCWFRWEGSIWGSPLGVTMAYNNTGTVLEDVLATWSGESMPESYTNVSNGQPMSNFNPYAAGGVITVDRIDSSTTPKHANAKLRGSIVYNKSTDRVPTTVVGGAGSAWRRLWLFGVSGLTIQHVLSVMDPAHPRFNDVSGISLTRKPQNCTVKGVRCDDPVMNNTATNITSIRGSDDTFHYDWTVEKQSVGGSLATVESPWTATSTGANLCYRWGTTTPLWPWPMNERIKAATASAGSYSGPCPTCVGGRAARTPTDVTADIEELLGTIPDRCRNH